ncbi:hypothetical protein [Pedobacter paludis]|uniref:DUF4468 domain-containing protein n=1 Tax=Pedobacter paludis TaxID=2203212 RepID=A0A317EWL8_9SPHI|nr:hypothetical protein [Pedobacter paludis]PWS31350.1 hypothetical protein DF947_12160 [Pedobacter paludis]
MRTKLTLVLLLVASFNGFAQTKAEIVKTINQLLAKAIGGTNITLHNDVATEFKITANSFSIDEEMNFGVFTIGKSFTSSDHWKEQTTNKSQIQHWNGFRISSEQNSTNTKSIYPVSEKIEGEPDNGKNGIKYYCLAGDEDKLIAALLQLQGLYKRR